MTNLLSMEPWAAAKKKKKKKKKNGSLTGTFRQSQTCLSQSEEIKVYIFTVDETQTHFS